MKLCYRDSILSLEEYNLLASSVPAETDVFYQYQLREPPGYDSTVYGPWCGDLIFLQVKIASSHKTPTSRQVNIH